MELQLISQLESNNLLRATSIEDAVFEDIKSTEKPFINANTMTSTLAEIKNDHILPVFIKDNEPVIGHYDFINVMMDAVGQEFPNETILTPSIRLSHPIKGRIPDAKDKPAKDLLDFEKTIYYERMAFIIEIPTIKDSIGGNSVSLTIGGVKAYNLDNLNARKGTDEHFKIFIGFQNKVCTNMCVWSDGYVADLRVKSLQQLRQGISDLVIRFNAMKLLWQLEQFTRYQLTEQQFAHLIGKCKLYQYLSSAQKKEIPPIKFGDTQLSIIAKDYYQDEDFKRSNNGCISLWKAYNLLTGANKTSYIDTFLDRSVNTTEFVQQLVNSMEANSSNWYLG